MPYQVEYDSDAKRCFVLTWRGEVDVDALLESQAGLMALPGFRPGINRLHDFRKATVDLSASDIRLVVARLEQANETHGHRKVGVLVAGDLSFGVSRMYETLARDLDAEFLVTRDAEEAKSWVDIDPAYTFPGDRA